MDGITVMPGETRMSGICPCCGHTTRTVDGSAHGGPGLFSRYVIGWSERHVLAHGATINLILSESEEAGPEDRVGVCVDYRVMEGRGSFMVVDAGSRPPDIEPSEAYGLLREEVIGTPLKDCVFAVIDAIFAQDERIGELRGPWALEA